MTANKLKLIACFSMLIDHLTYCFIAQPPSEKVILDTQDIIWYLGRGLGRSAFIIFSFLLVEGFFYTKKLKNYVLRLLILAIVAEAAMDFMCGQLTSDQFYLYQNSVFLFVFALILMYLLLYIEKLYSDKKPAWRYLLSAVACTLFSLAVHFLNIDYGILGMCLILIFFYLRKAGWRLVVAVIIWSVVGLFCNAMLEWAGLIALIPIMKYNGEKGKGWKWGFYIFYPLHMFILGLVKIMIL